MGGEEKKKLKLFTTVLSRKGSQNLETEPQAQKNSVKIRFYAGRAGRTGNLKMEKTKMGKNPRDLWLVRFQDHILLYA